MYGLVPLHLALGKDSLSSAGCPLGKSQEGHNTAG